MVIRLERNYRSTGHILAAASHLIAHNEGRLGKTLRTEDVDGEKVTVTGAWDSRGGSPRHRRGDRAAPARRRHKLNEIAILVRASFQMREFEDRFVTLGLPYRVIGGPRFYERAEIRDALAYLRVINSASRRSCLRAHRQRAQTRPGRCHRADAARASRASGSIPLSEAAARHCRNRRVEAESRADRCAIWSQSFDRWRVQRETMPHTELAEIVLDECGYTEMWQKDRSADAAGPAGEPERTGRSMEEFENLQGFLEHISLVMDRDGGGRRRCRLDHDAAFRQRAGIRHRLPAGLGGRSVSRISARWMRGPRWPRRRAPPRACRADAGAPTRKALFRHQSPYPRLMVNDDSVPLPRRTAGGKRRDHGIEGWVGMGRNRRLRPLAVRQHRGVWLELCDAWLATRAGQSRSGRI